MTFGGKLLRPAPRCRTRRTPSPSTGSSASRRTTCSARTKAPGSRRARGRTPRAAKPGTFQLCSAPYCWFWDLQGRWLSGSPLPYLRRYMLETAAVSIFISQASCKLFPVSAIHPGNCLSPHRRSAADARTRLVHSMLLIRLDWYSLMPLKYSRSSRCCRPAAVRNDDGPPGLTPGGPIFISAC